MPELIALPWPATMSVPGWVPLVWYLCWGVLAGANVGMHMNVRRLRRENRRLRLGNARCGHCERFLVDHTGKQIDRCTKLLIQRQHKELIERFSGD